MSLSGYHDWEADKWEFVYDLPTNPSESTGEISPVGPERQSPLAGLADFGVSLVRGIFDFIRDALSGVARTGAAIIGPLVDGAISLLGGAFDFIGNLFFGWNGREKKPLPPIYSDVFTDIEAATQPFFDVVDKNLEDIGLLSEALDNARADLDSKLDIVTEDIRAAEEALEAVGDVDRKIADQALIHTQEAAKALGEARDAMDALISYKEEADPQIQSALADSRAGLTRLDTLEPEIESVATDLESYKTATDGKVQEALTDSREGIERLEVLEPKVSTVISDLDAYEKATNAQIQDLLDKANGAISDAGQALSQYDALWEDHEALKTDAGNSIDALKQLTQKHNYSLDTIESDLPGMKDSITTAQAKADAAVVGTKVEYAVGTSETTAPTTGWSTSTPTRTPGRFVWMRSIVTYGSGSTTTTSPVLVTGNTGAKGTDGVAGKDGVGLESTVVMYAVSSNGTTPPTSGWQVTVPTLTQGNYLWTRTVWAYSDDSTETGHSVAYLAKDGSDGDDGLPGKDGVGIVDTVITYAASSSGTTPPSSGWVATPPAGTPGQFIWTRTVWHYSDSTSETGYSVGKIGNTGAKGDRGIQGIQGVPGPKGEDGQTTYTWIKYADSASGAGLSDSPVGKTYIGFAYNRTTATESTVASDYTWSLIQGPQGNQGVPGPKGADGQPTYTWVKYSDAASGASPYDVPKASTKYIGIAVNKTTQAESSNPGDYVWSQFRGEDGRGVSSTAVTYAASASGTTTPSSWSSTIPTVAAGSFLWTRTVITYTDGTSTSSYSIARQGANGSNGAPGAKGADGKTSYLHVAYAGNSTGTSNFSTTDPTGREWVGTYTDFTEADSNDPSKYTWQLVKGADGQNGKGVQSATVTYAGSTSGTTIPTSGWQSTIPTVAQGRFLWTRTVTTFTDGATTTTYINARQGADGSDGVSVTAVVPYYQLVNRGASAPAKPTTASPSGWTTTEPDFQAGKELYRSDRVTYSSGATSWTDVSKVSSYTAATEAMSTAVDALAGVFNSTDIGSSLVAYIPGTSTPIWADTMTPATPEENPQGLPEAYVFSSMSNTLPMPNSISVNPGIDYKVSVWIKADKPDSKMYYELRDQDSAHAVQSGSIGGGGTYLINNLTLPTEWTLYETVLTFRPGVKRIYMARRYANHSNGTERNAVQYMADLRIDPVTVTPADVTNTVNVVADSLNNYRTTNDKAVSDANKAAQVASGLAESKGEVIYQATAPTGARASKANLWIRTSDNAPHTYDGSKWVAVTDQVAKDAAKAAADANTLAKSKTTTYYQTSAPSGTKTVGDLWIDQSTAGKNTLKRWSGSAWVVVQDKAIAEAMAAAGTAQSTADGKVRTFAQTSAPAGVTSKDTGDLWIDTDDGNKLYRWSGSAWISLQDKGIVTALNLAQKGVDDAKAVADKIPALDGRLATLSSDQESIGEKAQQGIDDAKSAADLVKSRVDVGTSLVGLAPGTTRPAWSMGMDPAPESENPLGLPDAYVARAGQTGDHDEVIVSASDKVKYRVSFWLKASEPGSDLVFDARSPVPVPAGGDTLAFAGNEAVEGALDPGDAGRVFWVKGIPTEWTYYEGIKTPSPGLKHFYIGTRYWRHAGGSNRTADQYVADLRIEPIIPSQDDVNKLLIDTAQNHSEILKAQEEINDIHAGKWEDQSALNAMQLEIDESQNTAIQGLTASTMLAFPHMNVAPEDSSGRPWWSVGMSENASFTPPGFPSGPSWWTSSSSISNVNPEALITVVPGIDYKLEFWTARVDEGTAGAFVDVRNESGGVVLTHWADVTDGVPTEINWSARNYAGGYLPTSTDWIRKVYLLRVQPGTNKMALHFRPGGTATTNGTRVRFWGAHLSAFMPIQEQLDSAQTDAILANAAINDSQTGLIAANNKAIKATTEAVSAHQRILQVAYPDSGSAIPMVPGGVNVGTDDEPVYEAMPEWLYAYGVTKVTGVSGMEDKRAAHSKTSKTVDVGNATMVRVNPTALYRYSFWIQASASGSEAFIRLLDQNGGPAVLENIPDAGMPAPRESTRHLFWFNGNVPATNGWSKISGTIRLNPDVTHVYIAGIGLNYQGTTTSQWLADIQLEPIIPSQSDVNKALADVNAAQTAILSGHQDVLDMAFPNTSLVPMTNGVPEWTSAVSANPIRTPEGNWRFTSATAIQPGTGGKHVPTVNEVTYRAMARLRRTGSGGTFSIRLRGAGSTASITSLTAVTDKPAPAGASRKNFLTANQDVGTDWETWYYDFTLPNNTGDVRVGYVIGSTGVEVSQLSVVALLPDQSEYNRINNEINSTQNDLLHDHQRVLDLMNPAENITPMVPGGLNVGTESAPKYMQLPWWINDSRYQTFSEGSLPGGNRVAVVEDRQRTPSIGGDYFPVTPGGEYRYEFFFKAPVANSGLVIYLVGEDGSAAFQSNTPDNLAYGNPTTHLWWSGNMPGGTGPEVGGFYKITGKLKFRDDVTQAKINRVYYNWSGGSVTSEQTVTGLRIWADVPSQSQVNEGFSTAIEANTKAIRLAFPDLNLDPQGSNGHPAWSSSSAVTVVSSGNPGGRDPAYRIAGSAGTGAGFMDLQPDLREYRIRGWVTPGSGTSPRLTIMVINQSGTSVIEAWRPTFPADKDSTSKEDSLKDYDEVQWTSGASVALTPANGMLGSPGEWSELDIVVRLKAGETSVRLALVTPTTTNNWVLVNDVRFTTLNPSQWKVDYAQNRALTGLNEAFKAQQTINTTQGELNDKLEESQESLLASLRELQGAIWRVFPVENVAFNSATELSTHIQVRKNSSSWLYVDARGSSWSGDMILTGFYEAGPPFVSVVKITSGVTGRTNGIPRTQSSNGIQQLKHVRIDFRVDPERVLATKVLENFDPGKSSVLRSDLEFDPNKTAAAAPNNGADGVFTDAEAKSPVLHYIDWEVVWDATTATDSYLMEVGVVPSGGTTMNSLKFLRVDGPGPTFPWQNGRRTTTINVSANLSRGDKLVFAIWSGAGQSSQRKVAKTTRTVSWMKP